MSFYFEVISNNKTDEMEHRVYLHVHMHISTFTLQALRDYCSNSRMATVHCALQSIAKTIFHKNRNFTFIVILKSNFYIKLMKYGKCKCSTRN